MKKTIILLILLFSLFSLKSQDVYKTPSGKKYHLGSCRMVNNVSRRISLDEAYNLNLEPCKFCKPSGSSYGISKPQTPRGETSTVRCKGTTKSGQDVNT